jgi:FKBP-type peptidyl-prolyl cis-trans isomerase SlyD
MTDQELKVSKGLVVSLDYTLRLQEGDVVDASAEQEPLEFLQGSNQIIPGLEQALYGMSIGEEAAVVVEPEQGYGQREPSAFQRVPLDSFPKDIDLELGMGIELVASTGQPLLAFVTEIGDEDVLLDFNHPLAGETLYFDVRIADLRQATPEELEHGHAHGHGHEH